MHVEIEDNNKLNVSIIVIHAALVIFAILLKPIFALLA
jgi:hypothetical protein